MPRVVELAGGVGGAKLADGLQVLLGPDLAVVVNTGDDFERHGLDIWPDHDTVAYTLAGLDDSERGWGLAGETWTVMDGLAALGDEPWFGSGTATSPRTCGARTGCARASGRRSSRATSRHGSG